jgi:glycerol-3-phosphate acyltransferase PlsY
VDLLRVIIVVTISYLIGSILTGEIVARFKKVNIRSQGSGNVGATNVYRSMGSLFGAVVLLGDVFKGVVAVSIGRALGAAYGFDLAVIGAVMVIIGHNWSVFAGFHGGKGIATSLGVIIALTPISLTVVLPIWILFFLLSGFVSLASVLAAVGYPISALLFYFGNWYIFVLAIVLAILAIYRHRGNLVRLTRGQEHRFLYHAQRGARKK